jgi:hypothetical protein
VPQSPVVHETSHRHEVTQSIVPHEFVVLHDTSQRPLPHMTLPQAPLPVQSMTHDAPAAVHVIVPHSRAGLRVHMIVHA